MNKKIEDVVIECVAIKCKADKRSVHIDHRLFEDLLLTDEEIGEIVEKCNSTLGRAVSREGLFCDVADLVAAYAD